jgi:hypothetical protein
MNPYQQERFEIIQEALAVLAEAALDFDSSTQEIPIVPPKFSKEDIVNCAIICNTIFSNSSVHKMQEDKISLEDGKELSYKLGNDFRMYMRSTTGIDMHDLYN